MAETQWTTGVDSQQLETILTVSPRGVVSCLVITPREEYDAFTPVKAADFLAGERQKDVVRQFGAEVLRQAIQAVERTL